MKMLEKVLGIVFFTMLAILIVGMVFGVAIISLWMMFKGDMLSFSMGFMLLFAVVGFTYMGIGRINTDSDTVLPPPFRNTDDDDDEVSDDTQ